ncbi:hypothetical protein N5079_03440 [Planotetraspora sp. A-T 1434]|nr:hypothetical protein [Planotetraspora sp. A-T 1434]MCT9929267.1 hypothetical protein [Planotetraspora sp. A-T 1434]
MDGGPAGDGGGDDETVRTYRPPGLGQRGDPVGTVDQVVERAEQQDDVD